MDVLWLHSPHALQSAVALELDGGSFDEPHEYPGLAHFLEHMVFRGSRSFAADDGLMSLVQRHGGQVNASTQGSRTLFHFQVDETSLADALARLVDQLLWPLLEPVAQRSEREVIDAEFRLRGTDPDTLVDAAVGLYLNPAHGAARFHAGNRDSLPLDDAFQQALRAYHQRIYAGAAVRLVIVSREPADTGMAALQAPLSALTAGRRDWRDSPQATWSLSCSKALHLSLPGCRPRQSLVVALAHGGREGAALVEGLSAVLEQHDVGLLASLREAKLAEVAQARLLHRQGDQALLAFAFEGVDPARRGALLPLLLDWLRRLAEHDGLASGQRVIAARWPSLSALEKARHLLDHVDASADAQALTVLIETLASGACLQLLQDERPVAERCRLGFELNLEEEALPAAEPLRFHASCGARTRAGQVALAEWQGAAVLPPWSEPNVAAFYLHWADCRPDDVPTLQAHLADVRSEAWRQGVRFDLRQQGAALGLGLLGYAEALPVCLDAALAALEQPWPKAVSPQSPTAGIAVRQLLAVLPQYLPGAADSPTGNLANEAAALLMAHDQSLASRLAGVCVRHELVARAQPQERGMPAMGQPWHRLALSNEAQALVLFVPDPLGPAAQVAWRLLGQYLAAPFQQRLRDDLHLGYALYCGHRWIAGQPGLLFAIQSDASTVAELWQAVLAFFQEQAAVLAELPETRWRAELDRLNRRLQSPGSLHERYEAAVQTWLCGQPERLAVADSLTPSQVARCLRDLVDSPRLVLATAAYP